MDGGARRPRSPQPAALRALRAALLAAALAALLGPVLARPAPARAAGDWLVLRASANAVPDFEPHVADGVIAWQHADDDHSLAYIDLATQTARTVPRGHPTEGYFLDDGRLVWMETVDGLFQLFVHDVTTGVTRQLTEGPERNSMACLSGSELVWVRGEGDDAEVMLQDLSGGPARRLTTNTVAERGPRVESGMAVWTVGEGNAQELFVHDTYSGITRQVTTNGRPDYNPVISAGRILWIGGGGTDTAIFDCDIRTGVTQQLTPALEQAFAPHIDGGRAAWFWREPGEESQVMQYEPASGRTTPLTDSDVQKTGLIADMAGLVWVEGTGDGQDVYVREPFRLITQRLSDDTERNGGLSADGGLVMWTRGVYDAEAEVYLATKDTGFADVSPHHPHGAAIGELTARKAISGFADGTFGPDTSVWRQQFVKMIVIALRLPTSEADLCPFSDVEIGGPGTLYPDNFVAVAAAEGITQGTGGGLFSPYADISRAQAVTMVVRAVQARMPDYLAEPPSGYDGTWGAFSTTHQDYAQIAEYNHLLDGMLLRRLDPWGAMTRAELAQMLYNMVCLMQLPRPPILLGG